MLRLPFDYRISVVGGIRAIEIISIPPTASASANDWMTEGTRIYGVGGRLLDDDRPLDELVRPGFTVDPDGQTRVDVRYRRTRQSALSDGVLALPVERRVELSDGTVLVARNVGGAWAVFAREVPGGDPRLTQGDLLLSTDAMEALDSSPSNLGRALDGFIAATIADPQVAIHRGVE